MHCVIGIAALPQKRCCSPQTLSSRRSRTPTAFHILESLFGSFDEGTVSLRLNFVR